jgi:hypothetical protein
MAVYLDTLQQPNGLFYHAPDVPFFRGRGNGWMAAGMAELLRSLAEDHPNRARILSGYRKIMATLLQYQMGWHVAAADRSSRVVGRKHRAPACSHSRSSRESSKAGSMRVRQSCGSQGLAWSHSLFECGWRCSRGLRRYEQEETWTANATSATCTAKPLL